MPYKSPVIRYFGTQRVSMKQPIAPVPYMPSPTRPHTAHLDNNKRRQLETILDREKSKEQKERLAYVLSQKLARKFGTKHTTIIDFFVDEFLSSHGKINGEDLLILEKEISNAINTKISKPPSANGRKEELEEKKDDVREESATETLRPGTGTEWQLIQTYQMLINEDQEREKQMKLRNQKQNFKKNLDEHINYAKSTQEKLAEEDRKYAEYVQSDIQKYHEQQAAKQAALKKKQEELLEIRRQQQEYKEKLQREHEEALRRDEESYIRFQQTKFEKEQELARQIKIRENAIQLKILQDNAENDRRREIQKKLEAEEDQRLMAEYAAKLDKENAAREAAFKNRMAKMEASALKFENDGAGKAAREERLKFEQMLVREQLRKAAADQAAEDKKREDARRRQQLASEENKRQLEEKRRKAELEREENALFRDQFQRELDNFKQEEAEKKRRMREKQEKYRDELNNVMESARKNDSKMVGITPVEKQINMPTLKKIEDPQMMSRVLHRVRLSKTSHGKR